MRILIIEDKGIHIQAAINQLSAHNDELLDNHELTICPSYVDAERVLAGSSHWYKEDADFPYDVVLTDLFLPPSLEGVVNGDFGKEIPYGIIFALTAMRRGVPVAIVTDASHHDHPINWALDMLGFDRQEKIEIGTSVFCTSWSKVKNDNGERVKNWKGALDKLLS